MNLTSSETQTACEQKRSLIHFPVGICYQDESVKRFLLKRSCCFNDKYFSICSRHYSTIKHKLCYWGYFSNPIILLNHMKKGRMGALLLWCTSNVKPHRDPYFLFWCRTCFTLQVVAARRVVSYIPIHSFCLGISTLSAISRSTRGEGVCYSLYQEWRMFFFFLMFHYFVKCFTKNQPQNNKWPKSLHGFMTKKGSVPFMYRTMHKKQLNCSVRLLNSAGGVYFVIAAVPMSL